MPDFTFEESTHTYRVGGISWMSVTQSLPNVYYGNNTAAMEKGRFIHDMCRMYLLNDLDESSLDSSLMPYLDALKKFLHDSKGMGILGVFDIKSGAPNPCVELQVSAYVELCKQWDVWINTDMAGEMILETPLYHPLHQYAGTPDIIISGGKQVREGHALYLKDNGNYSLSTIKNIRQNFETFLCFLRTAKWRREKGISEWKQQ